MGKLRRRDWEAVAGIVAAVVGLVLHLLHVVDEGVVLSIILVILALVILRDLRREDLDERSAGALERTEQVVTQLMATSRPPDAVLVGPPHLREASRRFAQQARGEMTWFNVCLLMFVPQSLFDALLRPAIENPRVSSIQFVLDRREQERWRRAVRPKLDQCGGRDKVQEPVWCDLNESTSFILSAVEPHGELEAHVSFWGEPFMARSSERDVPRFIFHVQRHSELIGRLVELARHYRVRRIEPD
jgi:hypothetical protein